MRNKMIYDKFKIAPINLLQLENPVRVIKQKNNHFKIVDNDYEEAKGYGKRLKKAQKFTILTFSKSDFSMFKSKTFVRSYISEAEHFFEDVRKISSEDSVAFLISKNKILKY